MFKSLPANSARADRYTIPLFFALLAAGLAGNYFKFQILNLDFIFGSIFAMLALQFFGSSRGILAAAIISSYTYLAWNHPYAIITMTAEVAIVGWLIRRGKVNLLMADTLYWLFIGIPVGFSCFYFISHLPVSNAIFLMTKQSMNGITNALIARLIFTGYALRSKSSLISFREVVSNLLASFALCSALTMLIVGSRTDFDETDRSIRALLIQDNLRVTEILENWVENRKRVVVNLAGMAAILSPAQMQTRLEQARTSDTNFLRIALLDTESTAVAYAPLVDQQGRSAIGINYSDRPHISMLKKTLKPMLSEIMVSRLSLHDPIVIMLAPVLSQVGYGGLVGGIMNFDGIKTILETSFAGQNMLYTLLDKNGNVIVTNHKEQKAMTPFSRDKGMLSHHQEGISQWIPTLPINISTIELWGRSHYIAESTIGGLAEWRLILEQPVAPFQKMLYDRYTGKITLLFLILIALLTIAELISRGIARTNERLSDLTHDLPGKLEAGITIEWPESGIRNSNDLIANFRKMANSLATRFSEIRRMNELLEKRIEERTHELKVNEEQLSNALEIAHLGHWEYDVATDLFTFNDHFYNIFRTTANQVGGYTMSSAEYARRFVHPDDIAAVGEETRKAIETKDPNFSRQREHRMLYADGSVGYISVRYFITKDTHGRTVKTYGVNQDITERKRAEEALKESEDKFKYIFDHSTIGKSITFPSGELQVNAAFFAMLGYSKEELHDFKWQEITHSDDIELSQRVVDSLLSGEKDSERFIKRYIHKDGSVVWADVSTSLRRDKEGRPIYFMSAISNITERKRAEEEKKKLEAQLFQAQKMESVGHLAGGVAHDYNNMLSIIIGYAGLALDKTDPSDPLHDDLLEILSAGKRSADITRQLLAFARQQTVAPKVLDINDTIESMLKMLRRLIGEDVDLAWLPGAEVWPVRIDPTQIDQIMANLCVNARDAIVEVGKVTIETKNVSFDEAYCADHVGFVPGDFVLLAVSDDGCGIARENMDKIFEPFFTTKGVGKGTGLGLATVYGIVKQNNGFINVYSEPEKGTSIKVYLSRFTDLVVTAHLESAEEIPLGSGETVLLVEDDNSILKLGKKILAELGYAVLSAATPSAASLLAEKHQGEINLLITDVVMPEMNGRDLSERLKHLCPNLKTLFMSGYTANVIAHQGVLDDGVCFMPKPFSKKDMALKVREALDATHS